MSDDRAIPARSSASDAVLPRVVQLEAQVADLTVKVDMLAEAYLEAGKLIEMLSLEARTLKKEQAQQEETLRALIYAAEMGSE